MGAQMAWAGVLAWLLALTAGLYVLWRRARPAKPPAEPPPSMPSPWTDTATGWRDTPNGWRNTIPSGPMPLAQRDAGVTAGASLRERIARARGG